MIKSKIKNLKSLLTTIARARSAKKKIVFTNGCFDIIHFGHVKYLEDAKKKGDILIVGLNSDKSVKKIKGKSRPIISQANRAGVLAALESVDFVVLFNEATPLNIIKKIKPDVLVKGSDWKKGKIVGTDVLKKYKGRVIRAKFLKGYSTSKILEKIVKKN